MKKLLLNLLAAVVGCIGLTASPVSIDSVAGDPLHARIYTLPNGLKVFTSVNRDTPRITAWIAVRVGGKNDPAETTGLAHYFEHLMFKGTEQFGTQDFAAEKSLLDSIENAFEVYRHTSDPAVREKIYAHIDSLSYQASLIAIPNEYDKLMSAIGAQGTNAFTSMDQTCYTEDIPSNQIDNWARIQADRFRNPILRGFHTELETIYEEKNMSMKEDSEKAIDSLFSMVWPRHPYGTQTVLGTQEHLKNPSIRNVRLYHDKWYVPNNMAIVLAGDFDPDEAVAIIEKYFGDMKPNPSLPDRDIAEEGAIKSPVSKDVLGPESECLYIAWQLPGEDSDDSPVLSALGAVLQNGYCGILDVNVNQQQKALSAYAMVYQQTDGGIIGFIAEPKEGQSLEELKQLLLAQADSLREGRFDAELIKAVANNHKKNLANRIDNNESRVSMMSSSFIDRIPWNESVRRLSAIDSVTKEDIVRVARKYLGHDNYAVVRKLQGEDPTVVEIAKPKLTPIATNRDKASEFLTEIVATEVEPIEPRFVDYDKDMTILKGKEDTEVFYVKNKTNDIASVTNIYTTGTTAIPFIEEAFQLLEYASTPSMTSADIQREFYKLACSYGSSIGTEESSLGVSGLSENLGAAMSLYAKFISEAQVDDATFEQWLANRERSRQNNKTNEQQNFYALRMYQLYGPKNPLTDETSTEALRAAGPVKILDAARSLLGYRHSTIYYGPETEDQALALIDKHTPDNLTEAPAPTPYEYVSTNEPLFLLAQYDMPQVDYYRISRLPENYDQAIEPMRYLYNSYFGGGMNAIVFQEMRESRSLAYSASAGMSAPSYANRPYTFGAYIATQADKLPDAMAAFDEIIEDMPESQAALDLTKKSADTDIRTARTTKINIPLSYLRNRKLGNTDNTSKLYFEALPSMTLDDVRAFQQKHVKGRQSSTAILGPLEKLDIDALRARGEVKILTSEEIFGY